MFAGVRKRSLLSLKMAYEVWHTDGVSGTLMIQIPAEADKPVEVFFSDAPMMMVADPWKRVS